MRSLFFKIFLSFLLTILLVTSVAVTLTYWRDHEFPPLAHQDFARAAIIEYGRDAITAFEQQGQDQLEEFIVKLRRKSGIRIMLFNDQGQSLSGQPAPRRMQHMVTRALNSGEVVFPAMGARNGLASLVRSDSGRSYVVALVLPQKPEKGQLIKSITHGFLGWRLMILLVVTAFICYLLARSLSSPISRLRQATRRFAAGDLSVRTADQIKGYNEIHGLACDFDEMAGKIEDLVASQKRLLRDISHELRSPLTRLGLALELARKQVGSDGQNHSFDRIELESERMNQMIGQLLELTRLEGNVDRGEFKTLDLVPLLQAVIRDASFEAAARDCHVVLSGDDQQLLLQGSEELLKQAFENVIRNAVKYTAAGTTVEVIIDRIPQGVRIRVLDCGTGVPSAVLEKLFDPFYRVADARERRSGGTGIGLAIAERSIRLHGGTIRARNRVENGLEIEIFLPKSI